MRHPPIAWLAPLRFGTRRRGLFAPARVGLQCAGLLAGLAVASAVGGPFAPALGLLMGVPVLIGAWALPLRHARALAAWGFAAASASVAWRAAHDASPQAVAAQIGLVLAAAVVAGTAAALAGRIDRLRRRLRSRQTELTVAHERIRLLATRDPVTGLFNRRALLDALSVEARRLARSDRVLSLALIDIGDPRSAAEPEQLRGFATVAAAELRGTDLLGRWGGGRFLLLLPETAIAPGRACVARIGARWLATPPADGDAAAPQAYAAGLCACRGEADVAAALERAAQALRRAQPQGPGAVEVEAEPPPLAAVPSASQAPHASRASRG